MSPVIVEQTMVIGQSNGRMSIENHYVTNGSSPQVSAGTTSIRDTLVVGGKDVDFVWHRLNGQEGMGKRTSTRSANGDTLEVRQEALFDGSQGPVTWQSNQKWWLSKDGKLLTVDTVINVLPFTQVLTKSVFKHA